MQPEDFLFFGISDQSHIWALLNVIWQLSWQRAEDVSADVFAGRSARALHDFAANRDAAHHLSIGGCESLAVDKWLTKCEIKPGRFRV